MNAFNIVYLYVVSVHNNIILYPFQIVTGHNKNDISFDKETMN